MDEYYWFGDVVDKLISNNLGKRSGLTTSASKIHQMYDAARKIYQRPMTLMAAEKLKETVEEGDIVLFITNSQEMDGPPGVASLSRAVDVGLRARPVILTSTLSTSIPEPARAARVLPETCVAAELMPVPIEHLKTRDHRVTILEFPESDVNGSIVEANKTLDKLDPAIVVASECMGRNKKGVYHSAWGYESNVRSKMDHVIDAARSRGIPTIGLGDNGNEMGFGTIEDAVRQYQKFGDKCQCPCGAGIATMVKADITIPATTANWACYGIEACLARIVGNDEVMHGPDAERRILYACANTGCPDGSTSFCTPTCDGTPHEVSVCIVELLKITVSQSFKEYVRRW